MQSSLARMWPELPPEIAEHIARSLNRNELATSFRSINKAAAAQFRGPEYTTIRLSQPVPPHAFAVHWLAPGATRGLTREQRVHLLCLTAASGVVANLEAAQQAAGCLLTYAVFEAAASAGQLDSCRWLRNEECPINEFYQHASGLLAAAAAGGHQHVCEWLLSFNMRFESHWLNSAAGAAHGGHAGLMKWLLKRMPSCGRDGSVLVSAAHGCDLATLQGLRLRWKRLQPKDKAAALVAAAGSPTPDWAAKVEWLEAQGCPWNAEVAKAAASCPAAAAADAPARLAWLRGRGLKLTRDSVCGAAESGNLPALQYLLVEAGVQPGRNGEPAALAAGGGHLAVLQALHAAGWPVNFKSAGRRAARGGHLHVLDWLVHALGAEAVRLGARLFGEAARSGSVELMAWLRERGCPWSSSAFTGAAESGCEAAMEWLAQRSCPMPSDGRPYAEACRHVDLATVRCLKRLGMPWGADGEVFLGAFDVDGTDHGPAPLALLRFLLDEGCPASSKAELVRSWRRNYGGKRWAYPVLELLDEYQEQLNRSGDSGSEGDSSSGDSGSGGDSSSGRRGRR
ncbi:hypothetical protein GPECTOR_97g767 [Gonium pectorale]|uniref:Uncharacterized protein n=1 Tax=Gonium pectorale TaxID=33097 RepID=A0A150G050_GONPE|nr:hypothetical protein GPECTOR_97g767 [Gonium pectorale]|eukprot:KXZ43229.1 hypothetical protein GPECTOR_97g767 [Gonium pectorale]